MNLCPGITIVPVLHGKAVFARHIRSLFAEVPFDCVAIDIPEVFADELVPAVENLPFISAVVARDLNEPVYYVPVDPCDPMIEGVRQCCQNRIPLRCIGEPHLAPPTPLPPFPDEYSITKTGFDVYTALCLQAIGDPPEGTDEDGAGRFLANRLLTLRTEFRNVLAIVHFRHFVRTVYHFGRERTCNFSFDPPPRYQLLTHHVNPDHLYFVLGELPFVTGKFEKERYDPFLEPLDPVAIIKDLFRETRDEYFDEQEEVFELSPARIQVALTFLRNLTVADGSLLPNLFDIVAAAKGVGGNSYALRVLKSARYYPYLPFETGEPLMGAGIDRISLPGSDHLRAVNLFRDTLLQWRTIPIRPDPSQERRRKYRFSWNPLGMCSHVPEDERIESFNAHLRTRALRVLTEDYVKTEKFRTSVKDGIDIRETLRNWYTGDIFVKELPPSRGKVDTVVIIFDEDHDELYPHLSTWFAEHDQESTLTFYATHPFEKMIGPGIARCHYGGLSLIFPPRPIPSVFELTKGMDFPNFASRLAYGGLLFSREKAVAYVAARKPGVRLRTMAARLKKHLVWIPLSSFSNETLRRLRRFHILNGKMVRSWASRFIGER